MKKLVGRKAIGKVSGASELNFSEEMRAFANYDLPKKVVINDCTLREGRQIEGNALTIEECVHIARLLEELGVPMMQIANFKATDYPVMKAISKLNLKMEIETMNAGHQHTPFTFENVKAAIDRALDCNMSVVLCSSLADEVMQGYADGSRGIVKGTIKALRERQIDITVRAAQYAKAQGRPMNVNLQDFLRCDFAFMEKFVRALLKAGINIIFLDDIAAPAAPPVYQYVTNWIHKRVPEARLGVHTHNDHGNSLNAVLAAVRGGAEALTCGINGYGERAGHCDLAQLVVNLEFFYGFDTGIRTEKLVEISTAVADIMRQPIPPMWPVTGSRAFSHINDVHWTWVQNNHPFLGASVLPGAVGGVERAIFGGEWMGRWGIGRKVSELGMAEIPDERLNAVIAALADEMRWRKRSLSDDEFRKAVESAVQAGTTARAHSI